MEPKIGRQVVEIKSKVTDKDRAMINGIAIPFINRLLDYNHGLFSRYKKNGNQLP